MFREKVFMDKYSKVVIAAISILLIYSVVTCSITKVRSRVKLVQPKVISRTETTKTGKKRTTVSLSLGELALVRSKNKLRAEPLEIEIKAGDTTVNYLIDLDINEKLHESKVKFYFDGYPGIIYQPFDVFILDHINIGLTTKGVIGMGACTLFDFIPNTEFCVGYGYSYEEQEPYFSLGIAVKL